MGRPFKILSDFDGVWTNQGPEARLLLDFTIERLAEARGIEPSAARSDVEAFSGRMAASPAEYGWAPDGRISAYVDEDPLVESSALCHFIDTESDPIAKAYREAVLASGYASLAKFAEASFRAATSAFRDAHPPCLVEDAAEILASIVEAGAEVVVISNSGADKIAAWFAAAGVDAGEEPGHALRLRGSAAKWLLGETDEAVDVAGRKIRVDRPRYKKAIEEETPDLIIGDVFSLDLALPHVMRGRGHPAAPERLALRRHAHTPSWVLDSRAEGAIDLVVDGVEELPGIVRDLLAQ